MSYYELPAEKKEYFYFQHREAISASPHFHGAVEMCFCEKGTVKVIIEGEACTLKAGQACFVDCFYVHSFEENPNAVVYILLGDRECFERFFARRKGEVPPRFFTFKNFALLEHLYEICSTKRENEQDGYAAFDGAMQILLAEISLRTNFTQRERDKQSVLVGNVLQYAEEHLCEDLSLFNLARIFSFSHEHLSRVLHKHLLENWNSYVNRLRVRRAQALLLKNPRCSVSSIAFECGFESLNTFYRAYKKEFGKRPKNKKL